MTTFTLGPSSWLRSVRETVDCCWRRHGKSVRFEARCLHFPVRPGWLPGFEVGQRASHTVIMKGKKRSDTSAPIEDLLVSKLGVGASW